MKVFALFSAALAVPVVIPADMQMMKNDGISMKIFNIFIHLIIFEAEDQLRQKQLSVRCPSFCPTIICICNDDDRWG